MPIGKPRAISPSLYATNKRKGSRVVAQKVKGLSHNIFSKQHISPAVPTIPTIPTIPQYPQYPQYQRYHTYHTNDTNNKNVLPTDHSCLFPCQIERKPSITSEQGFTAQDAAQICLLVPQVCTNIPNLDTAHKCLCYSHDIHLRTIRVSFVQGRLAVRDAPPSGKYLLS